MARESMTHIGRGLGIGLLGLVLVPLSSAGATQPSAPTPTSFSYTGADQSYVVGAKICSLTVSVAGADGGEDYYHAAGGVGGSGAASIATKTGTTLTVRVGQAGGNGYELAGGGQLEVNPTPSFGGGGDGGGGSGSGGGATTIFKGTTPLVIAGGGGGRGLGTFTTSGAGGNVGQGGSSGSDGPVFGPASSTGGGGGSLSSGGGAGQSAGGSPNLNGEAGSSFAGGSAANNSDSNEGAGGGGGGYFGGGGGAFASYAMFQIASSGGGGSGYALASAWNVTTVGPTQDSSGNGEASIQPNRCLAPGAPRSPVALTTSGSRVTVLWSPSRGGVHSPVTGYKVTSIPGNRSCRGGRSATHCVITGLSPGTQYLFSLKAQSNGVWSQASRTTATTSSS